jgi:hypothetical protein
MGGSFLWFVIALRLARSVARAGKFPEGYVISQDESVFLGA